VTRDQPRFQLNVDLKLQSIPSGGEDRRYGKLGYLTFTGK
jgi:hypothetical protein